MVKSSNTNIWLAANAGMVRYIIVAAILIMLLAGCAANQEQEAQEMEHLLIAAGFQMKLADTPQKLAHLKTLSQLEFIRHEREGQVNYLYADANDCKCIYKGDEKSYQRFRVFARQQKLAREQHRGDGMQSGSGLDATSAVDDAGEGMAEPWW
jgi:hypothetical protein